MRKMVKRSSIFISKNLSTILVYESLDPISKNQNLVWIQPLMVWRDFEDCLHSVGSLMSFVFCLREKAKRNKLYSYGSKTYTVSLIHHITQILAAMLVCSRNVNYDRFREPNKYFAILAQFC